MQPLRPTPSICVRKRRFDVQALAQKYHAPILIHVAEIKKELDDSLAQNHATPVQYMNRIGLPGPQIIAAHCIWVDETDRKLLTLHEDEILAKAREYGKKVEGSLK